MQKALVRTAKVACGMVAAVVVFVLVIWATRSSWLPHAIADAPNTGKSPGSLVRDAHATSTHELRVDVGPPAASLAIAIVESRRSPPRGTALVLHGIRDRKQSMTGIAGALSEAGYRAILVDLRGHGESTGDWLSFGPREAKDIVQVLDRLAADGQLALPLGVYGPSFGGAVALQLARLDPRVRAVVTVATFTRMRDIVPLYAGRIAPSWFVNGNDIDRAMDKAGALGGFDPDEADSVRAIAATKADVLLLHGRADANIPWQHAETLHAAAPGHSRLLLLDDRTHFSIMSDPTVVTETIAWFDRCLATSANVAN